MTDQELRAAAERAGMVMSGRLVADVYGQFKFPREAALDDSLKLAGAYLDIAPELDQLRAENEQLRLTVKTQALELGLLLQDGGCKHPRRRLEALQSDAARWDYVRKQFDDDGMGGDSLYQLWLTKDADTIDQAIDALIAREAAEQPQPNQEGKPCENATDADNRRPTKS